MKKTLVFLALFCVTFSAMAKSYRVQDFVSESGYSFVQFDRSDCPYEIKSYAGKTTLNLYGWNSKTGVWDFIDEVNSDSIYNIRSQYSKIFGNSKVAVIEVTNVDFELYIESGNIYCRKTADALKREEEAEKARIEEENAKRLAEEKRKAEELDSKAKVLAKGYIYHGIKEVERNKKLFVNDALEIGHAYFISGFVLEHNGNFAKIEYGDGLFFSSKSELISIDYATKNLKVDIVDAGIIDFFGTKLQKQLNVVIAGGKLRPVVIALVEE